LPPILITILSIICAIITNDYIPGGLVLWLGFIAFYYQIKGKWYHYIFSVVYSLVYSMISYLAGLYAYIFFAIIVYIPCYIYGIISWKKKTNNGCVEVRVFNLKTTVVVFSGIIAGGFGLGALMSLIPGQNMAYMDSTIQLFNVAACIFCSLRHRECWYAWMIQNALTLILWTINMLGGATSAIMVLIINVVYCVGNFFAVHEWNKTYKAQKLSNQKIDKNIDFVEDNVVRWYI